MTVVIPLTKGQFTIVDDEDADLAQFNWYAEYKRKWTNEHNQFRAARSTAMVNGRHSNEYMHRIILSRKLGRPLLREEMVDHIHGRTLDNRRSELRLATCAQNQANRGLQRNSTSGYKGVSFHKASGKWHSRISVNGKCISLGYHPTAEAASDAYCKAAKEHLGEFANLGKVS